jgi:hypothetical protein
MDDAELLLSQVSEDEKKMVFVNNERKYRKIAARLKDDNPTLLPLL